MIASTDAAVRQQRNQLSTATLSVTNLHNHAEYSGSQSSFGISYSGEAHDKQGNPVDREGKPLQDPNAPGYQSGWNGFNAAPPMVMNAKGQAESTTYGGISSARVTIRDNSAQQARTGQDGLTTLATLNTNVSSERDGSNRLGTILNEQQINANYNIVSAFGQEVSTFLSNRAKESAEAQKALDEERRKDPQQQNPERIAQLQQTLDNNAKWQPGGNGQLLLTAVSGAFSSNVTGSAPPH
ncbi:hypothetical protein [Leeia sp.]|uniref:hypothetical protein n=1 Tax=Leeia sp. TaxID=2884678 RepID=UPI0035B0BB1B